MFFLFSFVFFCVSGFVFAGGGGSGPSIVFENVDLVVEDVDVVSEVGFPVSAEVFEVPTRVGVVEAEASSGVSFVSLVEPSGSGGETSGSGGDEPASSVLVEDLSSEVPFSSDSPVLSSGGEVVSLGGFPVLRASPVDSEDISGGFEDGSSFGAGYYSGLESGAFFGFSGVEASFLPPVYGSVW